MKLRITRQCYTTGNNLVEQYHEMGLSYPKFFKMDNLSKLGYLSATKLLKASADQEVDDHTALVFCCSASSLDSDCRFIRTTNEVASPSVFVYTLPNIFMGEIAIAFRLGGENTMYVAPDIESADLESKVRQVFAHTATQQALCGWIDYAPQGAQEALSMLVERTNEEDNFTNNQIIKLIEYGRSYTQTQGRNH